MEVRKVMAGEVLMSICSVIPGDMFELDIYEKVIELVYDAEISVKVIAIRLVFKVSEFLGEDLKRTRMVSLFIELLQSVNLEVVKVMSETIGDVLGRLETLLRKTSHLATILSVYQAYAHHKHPLVRIHYLANLPSVIGMPDRPLPDPCK